MISNESQCFTYLRNNQQLIYGKKSHVGTFGIHPAHMSPTERVKISLSYSIATLVTCPKSALLDGKMTDESFLDIKKSKHEYQVTYFLKLRRWSHFLFQNAGTDESCKETNKCCPCLDWELVHATEIWSENSAYKPKTFSNLYCLMKTIKTNLAGVNCIAARRSFPVVVWISL